MSEECNCAKCTQYRKKRCTPGFPKFVWFSEHTFFSIAILVRDEEEFDKCVDTLVYMMGFQK